MIRGISFPFRLNGRGGIAMSDVAIDNAPHLAESIAQIIGTRVGDRVMEEVGSRVPTALFQPNDTALMALIKKEIVDAVAKWDKRVKIIEKEIIAWQPDVQPMYKWTTRDPLVYEYTKYALEATDSPQGTLIIEVPFIVPTLNVKDTVIIRLGVKPVA